MSHRAHYGPEVRLGEGPAATIRLTLAWDGPALHEDPDIMIVDQAQPIPSFPDEMDWNEEADSSEDEDEVEEVHEGCAGPDDILTTCLLINNVYHLKRDEHWVPGGEWEWLNEIATLRTVLAPPPTHAYWAQRGATLKYHVDLDEDVPPESAYAAGAVFRAAFVEEGLYILVPLARPAIPPGQRVDEAMSIAADDYMSQLGSSLSGVEIAVSEPNSPSLAVYYDRLLKKDLVPAQAAQRSADPLLMTLPTNDAFIDMQRSMDTYVRHVSQMLNQ
jgi:hypothetical protein